MICHTCRTEIPAGQAVPIAKSCGSCGDSLDLHIGGKPCVVGISAQQRREGRELGVDHRESLRKRDARLWGEQE